MCASVGTDEVRSARKLVLVVALGGLAGCGVTASRVVSVRASPCAGEVRALVVESGRRTMTVCEEGRALEVVPVRLGREGVGKSREGDRKTPSGRYALGRPLPSRDYGTFVPVGYPTAEQARAGYTGSAVGVHGPGRKVRWLGPLVNVLDTTDGCIGVASDEEASRLASWVRRTPGATIVIQ